MGLPAAVVLFGAGVAAMMGYPGPALADSLSSVRSQMSNVERQIVGDASRIHALSVRYSQALVGVEISSQQMRAEQTQVGLLTTQVSASRAVLRNELVLGYVGEYSGEPADLGTGTADPSVRDGYIAIAAGTLRDSLDSYTARQEALAGTRARLVAAQTSLERAAALANSARLAAISDAKSAQSQLDQLQVQLIDQQRQSATAGATAAGTGTQGLPVGGGLVEVVTSEVTPTTTGAGSGPPSPTTTLPTPTTTPGSHQTVTTTTLARPTPTTTPPSTTTTTTESSGGGAPGVWLELRMCESGDNYAANTGNGYYGAYQFSQQTWTGLGYPGRPDLEPPAMQDAAAAELQARSGWGQWPACSAALGL